MTASNYSLKRPNVSLAQSDTYSKYKSHNTVKGLVGIAPNGALTFVSDLYGGHCSDKIIVKHCGILQLLEEGDSVMEDRGFEIQDLLAPRKVYLNIPPFMRRKDQLNPDDERMKQERLHLFAYTLKGLLKELTIVTFSNRHYQILCQKILTKFGKSAVCWPILRGH